MTKLSFPFTEEKICALKVGDEVLISGIVFTGRAAFTPLQHPNCERHQIIPVLQNIAH
jgi:tartrate dehydratase beta subunit/fumarate hydratase class I family protein